MRTQWPPIIAHSYSTQLNRHLLLPSTHISTARQILARASLQCKSHAQPYASRPHSSSGHTRASCAPKGNFKICLASQVAISEAQQISPLRKQPAAELAYCPVPGNNLFGHTHDAPIGHLYALGSVDVHNCFLHRRQSARKQMDSSVIVVSGAAPYIGGQRQKS